MDEPIALILKTWGAPGVVVSITILGARFFFKEYKELSNERQKDAEKSKDVLVQVITKNTEVNTKLIGAVEQLSKQIGTKS